MNLAQWLLELVVPADQSECIHGDLTEEYSVILQQQGAAAAVRWYRGQALRTAARFLLKQFRAVPILLAALVSAEFARGTASWLVTQAVIALLKGYPVYHYVNARAFYLFYGLLIETLALPLLMGWLAARLTRGREVAIAITLTLPSLLLVGWWCLNVSRFSHHYSLYITSLLPNLLPWLAMFTGALLRANQVRRHARRRFALS